MAAVDILSVKVLENPAKFHQRMQFEITYEVRERLSDDVEWRVVYVGSADSESYDQELESVLVPADTVGSFAFVLDVDPPNPALIPKEDLVGVTIVLLTCAYKEQEFIRVGYYVNNAYVDPEMNENPPPTPQIEEIERTILADSPRVTRFPHRFDYVELPTADRGISDMDPMEDVAPSRTPVMAHQAELSRGAMDVMDGVTGGDGSAKHRAFAMMGGDWDVLRGNPFGVR